MQKEQAVQTAKQVSENWLDTLLNNPFVVFLWKLALAIIVVVFLIIISKIIAWSVKK